MKFDYSGDVQTLAVTPNMQKSAECKYEVKVGDADGPEAQFANVGDKLIHHWSCSGREIFRFHFLVLRFNWHLLAAKDMKILVKDCTVTDGNSEEFILIDREG